MKFWLKLIRRQLGRHALRTALTALGVAAAMLLFVGIESLGIGLDHALRSGDSARTLIVYRKNRFCPQTSFLPERYRGPIERLSGVESALPIKVFLNNCRASLDLIAFHGTVIDDYIRDKKVVVVDGDLQRFRREEQAAIVGRDFAARRGLSVGDRFRFGGVTVDVAGIFTAAEPATEGVILTHLEFLQRAGPVDRLGTVTQFEVLIDDARDADRIAREIDELFASAEEPTDTRPKLEFLGTATRDLRELLRFGRVFGFVCVLVVLVLVANTVLMSLRERRREFGVFRTLGYGTKELFVLVLSETALVTGVGAIVGVGLAWGLLSLFPLSLGVEGVAVRFEARPTLLLFAVLLAIGTSLIATIPPAFLAARRRAGELLGSV
ncbi:MAG: ABC transporter permease [Planctomycetes bacterium]|nr:ABC transporter permease [Planctomycetota bacterium]